MSEIEATYQEVTEGGLRELIDIRRAFIQFVGVFPMTAEIGNGRLLEVGDVITWSGASAPLGRATVIEVCRRSEFLRRCNAQPSPEPDDALALCVTD